MMDFTVFNFWHLSKFSQYSHTYADEALDNNLYQKLPWSKQEVLFCGEMQAHTLNAHVCM